MKKKIKPNTLLALLMVMSFFVMAGGAIIAPILYTIAGSLKISIQQSTLIIGSYALGVALALPIAGVLIDRYGAKRTLLPALICHGLCGATIALVSWFPCFLLLRFVQGLTIAFFMPAIIALVNDHYPEEDQIRVMGHLSAFLAAGSVVSPFIGGALSLLHWRLVFLLFCLTIPLAYPVYQYLPDPRPPERRRSLKRFLLDVGHGIQQLKIFGIVFVGFMTFLTFFASVIYIPILCKTRFGFSDFYAGSLLSVQGLSGIIPALCSQTISKKIGYVQALALAFVTAATGLLIFVFADHLFSFLLGMLISGIGYGLVAPLSNTLLTLITPRHILSSCSALSNMMRYFGQFLAPLFYGYCMRVSGFSGIFLAATLLSLATAAFLLTVYQRSVQRL